MKRWKKVNLVWFGVWTDKEINMCREKIYRTTGARMNWESVFFFYHNERNTGYPRGQFRMNYWRVSNGAERSQWEKRAAYRLLAFVCLFAIF